MLHGALATEPYLVAFFLCHDPLHWSGSISPNLGRLCRLRELNLHENELTGEAKVEKTNTKIVSLPRSCVNTQYLQVFRRASHDGLAVFAAPLSLARMMQAHML